MATTQETLETAVERLVWELRQVVQSADPERQDQLKELASALLNQELTPIGTAERTTRRGATSHESACGGSGLMCPRCRSFLSHPAGRDYTWNHRTRGHRLGRRNELDEKIVCRQHRGEEYNTLLRSHGTFSASLGLC